jgi:hypothetical protein
MLLHVNKYFVCFPMEHINIFMMYVIKCIYYVHNKDVVMIDGRIEEYFLKITKTNTKLHSPTRARSPSFVTFLDRMHARTHTPVGTTPLDEGSSRRRDLYLTTHNIHKKNVSMPPAGFEPAV